MKITREVVLLLETILEERIDNLIQVVLIKPREDVSPRNYISKGYYIYRFPDLPRLLERKGVLEIVNREENDWPYPYITIKGSINRNKAKQLIAKLQTRVTFPPNRDCIYENQILFLKLKDGSSDSIDFSKAKQSRKIFEVFWHLWKETGKKRFTHKEVIKEYKKLHNEKLEQYKIGKRISNARQSLIYPKEWLKNRIVWKFDKKSQVWLFQILPLK